MPRESLLDKTLFACDELSGFIAACAYVRPEGIGGMKPKSVKKKLKQPSFAAGVNRDDVYTGAAELEPESGMDFDAHLQFVIDALAERADELGLRGQGASRAGLTVSARRRMRTCVRAVGEPAGGAGPGAEAAAPRR